MSSPVYHPDFDQECRICGRSPCVVVDAHKQPDTELCAWHFFHDVDRLSWETWNDNGDEE
jgi:hypothetical protein